MKIRKQINGRSFCLPLVLLAALALRAEPVKVIFDTDMFTDYDDAGALAILHTLADRGECEILATISCTRSAQDAAAPLLNGKPGANASVAVCEIVNRFYGRPDIPVGAPKGRAVCGCGARGYGLPDLPAYRGWVRHADADAAPDAVAVYRRVLAAQPDASVTVCSVGFLTNLADLLASKGDAVSPLDGRALVAKKVKRWVAMGFAAPRGQEYNTKLDAAATKAVLAAWPTEAVFSDFSLGRDVYSGRRLAETDYPYPNPVKDAFRRMLSPREKCTDKTWDRVTGHPSWDETAALFAVRGAGPWFAIERGRYEMVDDVGTNTWTPDPKGPHRRLVAKMPKKEIALALDDLMCFPPKVLARTYAANWESLNARPCPQWWKDAKFGIFVHWGVYSVPAFAPSHEKSVYDCYAEHYANPGRWRKGKTVFPDYHARHFPNRSFADLAAAFTAEHFDPAAWAALFRRSGAKYVVLTSKHHEGFPLWPASTSPYYNAKAMGAKRDLCGELTEAVRGAGLHMGFYYSLLEWYHPLYAQETIDRFVAEVNLPQMKELVARYRPDIVWTDGEWDYPWQTHRGPEFLAWLYNESPVRESVVTNDRWGRSFRGHCGDHYTSEYDDDVMKDAARETHPWEECRGIGRSFGYNRFETPDDYLSAEACVETLCDKVSRGGNLLLNIGPSADGLIPTIMQERLIEMGRWLKVNGEAIYGTHAWAKRPAGMKKSRVYFTEKGNALYAIVFGPAERIRVADAGAAKGVTLIGSERKVDWKAVDGALEIEVPAFRQGAAPCDHALVFRISR